MLYLVERVGVVVNLLFANPLLFNIAELHGEFMSAEDLFDRMSNMTFDSDKTIGNLDDYPLPDHVKEFIKQLMESSEGCVKYNVQIADVLKLKDQKPYSTSLDSALSLFNNYSHIKSYNLIKLGTNKYRCWIAGKSVQCKTPAIAVCTSIIINEYEYPLTDF